MIWRKSKRIMVAKNKLSSVFMSLRMISWQSHCNLVVWSQEEKNSYKSSKTWEGVRNSIAFLNCFQNILKDKFLGQKTKYRKKNKSKSTVQRKAHVKLIARAVCMNIWGWTVAQPEFLNDSMLIKCCISPPLWACSLVVGRFMRNSHDLANSEHY